MCWHTQSVSVISISLVGVYWLVQGDWREMGSLAAPTQVRASDVTKPFHLSPTQIPISPVVSGLGLWVEKHLMIQKIAGSCSFGSNRMRRERRAKRRRRRRSED